MTKTMLSLSSNCTIALLSSAALAQWQPTRPVQIIVPNPPGGGPDFIARLLAPKLSEAIKQNIVVDNRSSNNGIVGTEAAARAAPDGSTMIIGNSGTHAINATLYKKLPYDPLRDFTPVSELVVAPLVLVIHPSVPAKSLKQLIAIAKQSPGKLNVAIAGATGEIAGNAIKLAAGIDMKNIPYKGGAPATIAVISGESDMTLTNYVAVAKHVEAGRLRMLGITNAKRSPQIPDVPTIAEGGLPDYAVELWYGLFLPAKVPAGMAQAVYKETSRIINLPEIRERLEATGHQVVNSTPETFAEKVRREVEKFRKIIIDSGMQQN